MRTIHPSNMICFALYGATQAMQRAYAPLLAPLGLTYPQYLLLSALWAQDDQSLRALGRLLQLESNTLTPLAKRLEAKGLVTRRRDTRDERLLRIGLSDEGRAMQGRAAHVPGCIARATGMRLDDLVALRDRLDRLQETLRASAG